MSTAVVRFSKRALAALLLLAAGWFGGEIRNESLLRSRFEDLCRRYAVIKVVDLKSNALLETTSVSCRVKQGSSCTTMAQVSLPPNLTRLVPLGFTIDPIDQRIPIGFDMNVWKDTQGRLVAVTSPLGKPSGFAEVISDYIGLSAEVPTRCNVNMRT